MDEIILDIETTGLDPLTCEITYIGIVDLESGELIIKEWCDITEKDLQCCNGIIYYWAYGYHFDVPFLRLQAYKKGIMIKPQKTVNLAEIFKQDCELLKGKHAFEFARFFGINGNGTYLSGRDMPKYYWSGEHDKIIAHLESDLKVIKGLWDVASKMGLLG